jgi:hypothetical protein
MRFNSRRLASERLRWVGLLSGGTAHYIAYYPAAVVVLSRRFRMTYTLSRLAPGSYDVLLHGVIIASLVQSGRTDDATWTAELLLDLPPGERPAPFTEAEHTFGSLEEARQWFGGAEIRDTAEDR